eukprot:COSAG06_NODE_604_length_13879_cov_4.084325_5_plen_96_part_00
MTSSTHPAGVETTVSQHFRPYRALSFAKTGSGQAEGKSERNCPAFVRRKHTLQAGVSIFAFDIHEKVNMAMSEIHNTNVPGTHYLSESISLSSTH